MIAHRAAVERWGTSKGAPPLDLADVSFREFVVWLEDTKIRATPLDSRGPLRAVAAADWPSAFGALARETGCELDATSPAETTRVFDHLLEQAVALDYRDNADDLGGVVKDLKNAATFASYSPTRTPAFPRFPRCCDRRCEGMDHPELPRPTSPARSMCNVAGGRRQRRRVAAASMPRRPAPASSAIRR